MGDTDAVDAVRKLCALDGVDELDAVEREAVSVAFNKAAAPRRARGERSRRSRPRSDGVDARRKR